MTGTAGLELRLLGRFAVRRDGVEIPTAEFGGRKVRTLVRVLATRRGTFVSNDALTEMLWPERAPADPAANLQVLVTRARKALGDATLIRTGPGGYSLAGGPACSVDAEQFLAAVERAQRHAPRAALAEFADALAGWGGEPLAEDAYSDWAGEFRRRLNRARQDALEQAAQLAIEFGEAAAAVEYASAAVEAEPLREAAALTLVRALAAAGDPAAALDRYEQYRRALTDELGIDPSETAVALHRNLLTNAVPAEAKVVRRRAAFTELPFVGRAAELERIRAVLDRGGGSCIVVRAPSGFGKSRLLRALAAETPTITARASRPEQAEPESLLRTLLRELLASDVTYRDRLPPRLDAAVVSLLPELEPRTERAAEADPETRRALLQEATLRLFGPVEHVVAVDDLQWADPTSLAVLETARDRLAGLRLVLAYRPEEVAESGAVAGLLSRIRTDLRVDLAGLEPAAIEHLVADPALASALADCTDRSPFAIGEVLRALADERLTRPDATNRWRGVEPREAADRARGLGESGQRQAIADRAGRQPPAVRAVLELLSLLAREVPVAVLAAADAADEADVLDRLAALSRAGLVRLGEIGWSTSHDMIGEAVAAHLDDGRRARLHGRLARALTETADEDRAEIARHWQAAGEAGRAASAYAAAAQVALDSYGDREAADLAAAALALRPPAALAAQLREVRAQARARFGDIAGAREDLRTALGGPGRGPDRARLLGRLAVLASGADDPVRAGELAELALLEAGSDDSARAQALEIDAEAMATFLAGDVAGGGAALRQAADLFEDAGDLIRVVTPRSTHGHARPFSPATSPAAGRRCARRRTCSRTPAI